MSAQTAVDKTPVGQTPTSVALDELSAAFADRHIGPDAEGMATILHLLDQPDLDALETAAVPATILGGAALQLPAPASETEALAELRRLAAKNRPLVQMIGLGYHDTVTPGVIKRNVLENPAWYTAYTPYQPEISQGRLEALLNFQTAVSDLTGLDIANASMLDEATAAAEAMTLIRRTAKSKSNRFVVDADTLPQTIAVVQTRAEPIGIEVVVADLSAGVESLPVGDFFGLLLSYPGASGAVRDHRELIEAAHQREAKVAVATDLLALTLLRPPGEIGADVAVGSSQRFGVPLGFGGPHAGFLAVRADVQRQLPGRLVGVSRDAHGNTAFRLALQTREQHIRREKATSNICTAQVLLAVMASMYAVYHGPDGLRRIAERVHSQALLLAGRLQNAGIAIEHDQFFDTVRVRVPGRATEIVAAARQRGINLWADGEDAVQISVSESTTVEHLRLVVEAFGVPGAAHDPAAVAVAGRAEPDVRVLDPSRLFCAPQRDRDDAVPAPALRHGPGAGPDDDPAGLLHDEAQRQHRDGSGDLAGVRRAAPLRPRRGRRRDAGADRPTVDLAVRDHRLRSGFPAAERGIAG